MSAIPSPNQLLERWRRDPPPPARLDEVKRILEGEYRAYEIPLYALMAEDYANDDEVRERLVDSLFTITHPTVLDRIYDEEAREMQESDPDEVDQIWRDLFAVGDSETTVEYNLLLIQHSLGLRTSVVLEREGDFATSFKVYGHSGPLIDRLTALIGFPQRPLGSTEYGMERGNLDDDVFVWYLKVLHRQGLLG
jgi:hypothetical protein